MQMSCPIDADLLNEARQIAGLPETSTANDILRHFVTIERQLRAVSALEGIGWEEPDGSAAYFKDLARKFRALIAGRKHTPAEDLVREGRDDR
ncbi:hypothetical protein [Rhizobium sp. SL86]|jgi:Arc/MetJ family transcription regulator|uniref:hypothetical protein n=1 Tax=Rhizobium sp. SL86 TaxID=2995148 RepID=UPI00227423C6|nr:hypothetical protein [Rhizobium sp. SL86]MCY1664121.1 hypothetical protein [Rhizobium sp. SL86]